MSSPASSANGPGLWDRCQNLPWANIMRGTGGVFGVFIIIIGFLQLLLIKDIKDFVNSVYQIIFGVLIIFAEMRWSRALRLFSFLTSFTGLGMFYVFLGGLALGREWYEALVGSIVMILGAVYIIMGVCMQRVMTGLPEDMKDESKAGPRKEMSSFPADSPASAASAAAAASQPTAGNNMWDEDANPFDGTDK